MSSERDLSELESAVAIVGMACRYPGAVNIDEFWRNLRDGVESIERYDDESLRAAGVSQALLDTPEYVKVGAHLRDMEKFDAGFFGFSPLDASIMDPQHRHFLECCWEAFEQGGFDPTRFEGAIGVWAGSGHNAYMPYNLLTNPELVDQVGLFLLRHTGNDKDFLATRVSYEFDLRGPSINVQTACSTSLVAVHEAAQSLLAGECDLALAGGVTIELPHRQGYLYRDGEVLSPDGHCRAFDARSNGTVFGSGAGVVLLRRLDEAIEDGDNILAIIRGSAINNDGRDKVGYLAPSVEGQARAVAEAISVAEIEPEAVQYIECHGTGTAVGDPIEIAALSDAYRSDGWSETGCAIGSVKSNIGHTDTAAGVASLIKVVQGMRHRQLPPSLHYESPNPEIDFDSGPFHVNAALCDWPVGPGGARRAAVNSLGVGGTNAHMIVEEGLEAPASSGSRKRQLLLLSARTENALESAAGRLADALRARPELDLADVAHTLRVGRKRFERRRAVVCDSVEDAIEKLEQEAPSDRVLGQGGSEKPSIAFMFPGGGAQYPEMGRELYREEPVFREALDGCFALLDETYRAELMAVLFPEPDRLEWAKGEFERPSLQLPALFMIEWSMARLWMSWGVEPEALIGHSMGENTAACLAGVFRLDEAIDLVRLRGRLFETVAAGGMLSIPLAASEVEPLLGPDLAIASVNAPELCVASGPSAALDELAASFSARDIDTRRIKIEIAAHSAMLEPILAEWKQRLESMTLSAPTIPVVSNRSGTWLTEAEATSPQYWVDHLRHSVLFAQGIATLLEDPNRLLLEVGPGRTLTMLARMHSDKTPQHEMLYSMPHPDEISDGFVFALRALGKLWTAGVSPDWSGFAAGETRRRVEIPTYPWEHQRHWIAPGHELYSEGSVGQGIPRLEEPAEWFHTLDWKRAPRGRVASEKRSVLVFAGQDALSNAILGEIRDRGHDLRIVREGSAFEVAGPGEFRVRPGVQGDYDRLWGALQAENGLGSDLLHLWNLVDAAGAADAQPSQADLDRTFYGFLQLAKSWSDADLDVDMTMHIVSTGMQEVAGEGLSQPLKSLLLGPCRVIPREFPNLRCRSLDLDEGALRDGSGWAARVVDELGGDHDEIAWRGRARLARAIHTLPLAPAAPISDPERSSLRPGGVYAITGGLGGLGLVLARHMAEKAGAKLALLGRSGLPDPSTWADRLATQGLLDPTNRRIQAVQELEALGAEVRVIAADVTSPVAMKNAIAEVEREFGALHGVVHAAGVLDDQPIAMKTVASAQSVLAPKVQGTLALDAAISGKPLDFVWLFSSVSATAGLPGQVDYTAANAFLDAFARHRCARGEAPTVAVAWGPWQEAGMAAELAREAAGGGMAEPRALDHALLDHCIHETAREEVYSTRFSTATHWLLDDHRVREGDALIPGTGYLELVRAALAAKPQDRTIEFRDVFLVAPFVVPDEGDRELRIQLERQTGDFVVVGRAGAGVARVAEEADQGPWTDVVRGSVRYIDLDEAEQQKVAEAVCDLEAISSRCALRHETFDAAPQPPNLRFGPRWGCLKQVRYGEAEALAELELPDEFAGDLETIVLHPAILDLATGCAHSLIPGIDDEHDFFVPMSYARVLVHSALPKRVFSHLRCRQDEGGDGEYAFFDVTIHDESGRECARIDEFMLKRVAGGENLIGGGAASLSAPAVVMFDDPGAQAGAGNAMLENMRNAIRPSEGLDALERILASGATGHVLVLPHDLARWIEELTASTNPDPAAARREEDPALLQDLAESEAAIREQEGVAEVAVTAHFDRPGERRLLAHLVWDPAQNVTTSELRRALRKILPSDLMPQNFVELDTLPRTADGAIDKGALEDPFGLADDFVAPRSDTEKAVAKVWQEILGIDRVSLYDNFFDIGGHSLLSMRVIVRVEKKLGVRLNNAIMVLQTLEQVAAEVDKQTGGGESAANSAQAGAGVAAAGEGAVRTDGDSAVPEEAADAKEERGLSARLMRAVRKRVGS